MNEKSDKIESAAGCIILFLLALSGVSIYLTGWTGFWWSILGFSFLLVVIGAMEAGKQQGSATTGTQQGSGTTGTQQGSGTTPRVRFRVTHCYRCKRYLDDRDYSNCGTCGWIRCPDCGACGCGYCGF